MQINNFNKRAKYLHGRGYHSTRKCTCGKGVLDTIIPILTDVVAPIAKTAVSGTKLGFTAKDLLSPGQIAANEIKTNKIIKIVDKINSLSKQGKGFAKVF